MLEREGVSVNRPVDKQKEMSVDRTKGSKRVLEFLNKLTKKKYSSTREIERALNMGYKEEQLLMIIAYKYDEWAGSEVMCKYIRPSTLFNRINIDRYIEEMDNEDER